MYDEISADQTSITYYIQIIIWALDFIKKHDNPAGFKRIITYILSDISTQKFYKLKYIYLQHCLYRYIRNKNNLKRNQLP